MREGHVEKFHKHYGLPTFAPYRSSLLLAVFLLVIVLAGALARALVDVVKLLGMAHIRGFRFCS